MPQMTVEHEATITADTGAVWSALQESGAWEGLGLEIVDVETVDDRLVSFAWSARVAGESRPGTAEVVENHRGSHMGLALDSGELAGTIAVSLTPLGANTAMNVRVAARSKGLLAALFWGPISEALSRGLPDFVERFTSRFDA
jgi:hypothetical protein